MTERTDIEPDADGWRQLSYTYRCGWVDWGHALPYGAANLMKQIKNEKPDAPLLDRVDITLEGQPAFVVVYGQGMGAGPVKVSTSRHWIVRKGLTKAEKERVGLAIFLSASMGFERLQGSFPFSMVTAASSFSPEDLVSNVIGFYSAVRKLTQQQMREFCGEVSVTESYRIWDEHLPEGLAGLRNETARPILFPTQEVPKGMTDRSFPSVLSGIKGAPRGALWTRLRRRFIDGRLVNAGLPLAVSKDGQVSVRQ